MALQAITTVLEPIMDYIVKPIGRQLGYLISYRSNIQNLKVEMEKLNKLREDVEQSKEEVESNLEIIGDGVKDWLKNTTEIQKVTTTIFPSEADIAKGCLKQGLISLYVLSRKAKKMINTVIQQRNDGRNYEKFTHLAPQVESWIRSKIDSDDGMSRQLVLANIIESLNDEENNMIAICGPGGVGKSRMVEKVIAKVEGKKLFNKIVSATVTQQFNMEKLQSLIAEALGLKLDEKSEMMRANKLKARLKMENKILLVLDDVWQKLDLEKIGIPLGKEHKGCKVIVTSRSHEVCSSLLLKGIKIFTIKSLSKKESWDLFRRNVGDRINDPVLNKIAQEISKECGGLPLAILTVASTLKDKRQEIWIGGLARLRSVLPNNITGLGDVFKSLKLSYDHIESDEARKLYLHCCLFPEDYSIPLELLAVRGMSLGMFMDVNSLQEAKIRVNFLVDKLTNYFLLQKGKDDSSVIMHDAFRDLAIYITSREQHLFGINHDFKLKEWPRDIHHEEVTCISVRLTTIVKHPKTLNCPRLELLELETWKRSVSLHDDIFQGSRALKTIEISRMKFSLLPSSIGLLKNLRMLRLIDCEMENISMIGELVNLEILSLRYSRFNVFPAELRRLEKLKLLDLNCCKSITSIAAGTLSNFVELEELDMMGCHRVGWEVGNKVNEMRNVSLVELKAMQNLTTLRVDIISDKAIPKDTSLPGNLKEYFIRIRPDNRRMSSIPPNQYSKTIQCVLNAKHVVDWIQKIVVGVEHLVLEESLAKHIIDLLARESFQHVKRLEISSCHEVIYIANTWDLINLGKTPGRYDCFANLEYIKIRSCTNIVYFLSMPSVSEAFPLLTSLEVWGCKNLEQVFLLEEENLGGGRGIQIDKVRFPRLEKIQLYNLEALNGFCNGIHNIQLPSLHTLTISKLPNIRGFFPNDDSLSTEPNHSANTQSLFRKEDTLISLRHLELYDLNDAMLFHNQLLSRCCFRKLDSLSMSRCKNVAPCLFMDVVNDDAPSVKDEEEQGEKVSETSLFPHLTKLILSDLPDLRSVVSQNMQKVPFGYNLKEVYVGFCQRLVHFSSLAVARTFAQQVENMSFVVCNEMKHVFVLEENEVEGADQSQICDIQFPMLRTLKLSYLPAMASFCKGANNIDFPNLNEIYISASNNLKGFVIPTDGDQSSDMHYLFGSKVSFGGLESMVLLNLESELWYHQLSNTQYFSKLQNLFIQGCREIKYVFSSFSTGALVNLKKLTIRCCFRIEAVIVEDEGGEGMHLFPKLEVLELQELPKLGSFSQRKHDLQLLSLKTVKINYCSKMQTFAQGYISAPRLDELQIDDKSFPVNDINNSICQGFEEQRAQKMKEVAEQIAKEEEELQELDEERTTEGEEDEED